MKKRSRGHPIPVDSQPVGDSSAWAVLKCLAGLNIAPKGSASYKSGPWGPQVYSLSIFRVLCIPEELGQGTLMFLLCKQGGHPGGARRSRAFQGLQIAFGDVGLIPLFHQSIGIIGH